jgi:hypothetical protein
VCVSLLSFNFTGSFVFVVCQRCSLAMDATCFWRSPCDQCYLNTVRLVRSGSICLQFSLKSFNCFIVTALTSLPLAVICNYPVFHFVFLSTLEFISLDPITCTEFWVFSILLLFTFSPENSFSETICCRVQVRLYHLNLCVTHEQNSINVLYRNPLL